MGIRNLSFVLISFFCFAGIAFARIQRNADLVETGTFNPARHDPSSVTLRGDTPLNIHDSSVPLGSIRAINCVGVDCSLSNGIGELPAYSLSAASPSTFTFVLKGSGSVFRATNTFIPIPEAFNVVDKSTINVTEVQSFNLKTSSRGWASYNIAVSTQRLSPVTTWYYAINDSTVGTNSRYSVWTSTQFRLYPDYQYALHITSVSSRTGGGDVHGEYGIKLRGWVDTSGGN